MPYILSDETFFTGWEGNHGRVAGSQFNIIMRICKMLGPDQTGDCGLDDGGHDAPQQEALAWQGGGELE